MIACDCEICASPNPKNKRFRPSVLVSNAGHHILVDTSPDLRSQALSFGVSRVDAVLFTHHHADHILGVDDLRTYNYYLEGKLPCYSDRRTLERLRLVFDYAFADGKTEQSRPKLSAHELDGQLELFGLTITPFRLDHGSLPILGFLFEDEQGQRFGYATDCSSVPDESAELLRGVDLLILDSLRFDPHPTHQSLEQAVEVAGRLQARQTLLTHIAHQLEHEAVNASLPPQIQLAFDGQLVEFGPQ